jgi:Family of unknown function (DUF5683)
LGNLVKRVLTITAAIGVSLIAVLHAQAADSVAKKPRVPLHLFSFSDPHLATKASIYSAVIPGLGQIYNRKYWKLPLVYGSLGAATWFMLDQRKIMREYNDTFRAQYARNLTPDPYEISDRDDARRYRDFAILAMSAIYVLQIVDATVDAHFYKFNIDQDLQARVNVNPARAIQFTYRF